jgi:hypothetical protein
MADDTHALPSKTAFHAAWENLRPAILEEWSQVDATALNDTDGELDKVVALIAERAVRTKALVRRQLTELYYVVSEPPVAPRASHTASTDRSSKTAVPETVDAMLQELERRAAQVMRELRGGMLQDARGKVRENVFFSLLVALGLGFIVGVLFNGPGRGK